MPTAQAISPARIESAPRPGPTVRSSSTFSGAGSAPARSSSARSCASCTVKPPLMMPDPPRIGSRITGAQITLLSSTMANGLPTFALVASAKRRAPTASKRNDTTGWLSWKLGWASTSVSPVTITRRWTRYIGRLAVRRGLVGRHQLVARRRAPALRLLGRMVGVDQLEGQLGGLADQLLDALGIAHARQLDQDAVLALALDGRLAHAGLVDAPAHDLDRLVDGGRGAVAQRLLGEVERDMVARSPARWCRDRGCAPPRAPCRDPRGCGG